MSRTAVGIFLELRGVGGVQRLGRHTAAVLATLSPPSVLLSLRDARGCHELTVAGGTCTFRGFGGSRARLVLAALSLAPRTRLVYLGHPKLAPLGILFRALGAQVWVAAYGIDIWRPLPGLARAALCRAHGVIAISRATAEQSVERQGLDPERVRIVAPALDPDLAQAEVSARRAAGLPEGKYLLTVARLAAAERYKGVDDVIRALPRVIEAEPGARYVVVGDGDDRERLERLARERGVADRVLFTGEVAGHDVLSSYYEACEVFVMPSRDEGFGLVFVEAMAHAKPVVAAGSGGAPDVVVDGATGFLVDYGDLDALAQRLIALLRSDDLRIRMGEAGRERAAKLFSFESFQRRLLEALACAG